MCKEKDVKKDLVKEWLKVEKYWKLYKSEGNISSEHRKGRELQYRMAASNFFIMHHAQGNTVCRKCATIMHKSLLVNHLCRQCNADNMAEE